MGTSWEWEEKLPEKQKTKNKLISDILAEESWLDVLNLCGGQKYRNCLFPPSVLPSCQILSPTCSFQMCSQYVPRQM
jgi:hypothetical protein